MLYIVISFAACIYFFCLGKKHGFKLGERTSQLNTELRAISDTTHILLGRHICTADCDEISCEHMSRSELERIKFLIDNKR